MIMIITGIYLNQSGLASKKGVSAAKKSGAGTKPPKKEEKKGPSPQDIAATVMQKYARRCDLVCIFEE